jgi:hypothetical protein
VVSRGCRLSFRGSGRHCSGMALGQGSTVCRAAALVPERRRPMRPRNRPTRSPASPALTRCCVARSVPNRNGRTALGCSGTLNVVGSSIHSKWLAFRCFLQTFVTALLIRNHRWLTASTHPVPCWAWRYVSMTLPGGRRVLFALGLSEGDLKRMVFRSSHAVACRVSVAPWQANHSPIPRGIVPARTGAVSRFWTRSKPAYSTRQLHLRFILPG